MDEASCRKKPRKPQTAPLRAADRIRASASELFYREGIRAVGVDEVVERAGVTKPSLYRSFASKDDLAAAYLRDYDRASGKISNAPAARPYGNARDHVLAYISQLASRAVAKGYRGCGLSNAAVEYPSRDNPARQVAEITRKSFANACASSQPPWARATRTCSAMRCCF